MRSPEPGHVDREQHPEHAGTLAPFEVPTFRWLWSGFAVTACGVSMQAVGAQWFLVETTDGAGLVAYVQAALTLPMALLSIPSGVISDRHSRRRIMVAVQSFAFVVGLTLTVLALTHRLDAHLLLLLTLLLGAAFALTLTPFISAVPGIVGQWRITSASALVSVAANVARVVGPAAAGFLIASAGVPLVFAISTTASAFFVIVALGWRDEPARAPNTGRTSLRDTADGLRYVRASPPLRRLVLRAFWFTAPMMAVLALLPLIAAGQVGADSGTYGLLFACMGAGAIFGGMTAARLLRRLRVNAIGGLAFATGAAVLAVMPFARTELALAPLLFAAGWSWATCLSTMDGALQQLLPSWVRSRGTSLYFVATFMGQALGSLLLGWLTEATDLRAAMTAAAVALAVGATLPLWAPVEVPLLAGTQASPDPE